MIAGVAILALIVAALACAVRVRRYRAWLRMTPHRADLMHWRGEPHSASVTLTRSGFELPGPLAPGRTVLLQLSIESTAAGQLRDPWIEFSQAGRTQRQYFERGAVGSRYLNLSPLFESAETSALRCVRLRGRALRWRSQATLLVFDPPQIESAKVLVLAPHPDDAEIAAFGIYATHEATVVTITAGERATGNLPPDIPIDARNRWAALLRVHDSLQPSPAAMACPLRRANLVFPDARLEAMAQAPQQPFTLACEASLPRAQLRAGNSIVGLQRGAAACTWIDLVDEVALCLELSRPDVIVSPHPLIDGHSDHVATTVALEQALRRYRGPSPLLLLYAVHARDTLLYPFGPADSIASLAPGRYEGWVAESIYSHALAPELQRAKYFAVEAMHAVRSYDSGAQRPWRASLLRLRRELASWIVGLGAQPSSLLRRAPRPNEIYYVLRSESLPALLQQRTGG